MEGSTQVQQVFFQRVCSLVARPLYLLLIFSCVLLINSNSYAAGRCHFLKDKRDLYVSSVCLDNQATCQTYVRSQHFEYINWTTDHECQGGWVGFGDSVQVEDGILFLDPDRFGSSYDYLCLSLGRKLGCNVVRDDRGHFKDCLEHYSEVPKGKAYCAPGLIGYSGLNRKYYTGLWKNDEGKPRNKLFERVVEWHE